LSATTELFTKVLTSLESVATALTGLKGSVDARTVRVASLEETRASERRDGKERWDRWVSLLREVCGSRLGKTLLTALVLTASLLTLGSVGLDVPMVLRLTGYGALLTTTTESTTTTHEGGADDDGDAR
jgi:hypothetical protein